MAGGLWDQWVHSPKERSAPAAIVPRTMTTLHGTDITLVGSDPSYARVVAFSIEQSHGVTAVSASLKTDTISSLGIKHDISVIPNFLDCSIYRRQFDPELRSRLCPPSRSSFVAGFSLSCPLTKSLVGNLRTTSCRSR